MKKAIFLGLFLTLAVPFTSFAAFDSNLKYGSSGSAVTELQEFLTSQGVYSGPITGNFYSLTLAGVKAFQSKESISPVSGYWGPLSRAKANTKLDLSVSDDAEKTETGTVTAPVISQNPQPVVIVTPPTTVVPTNPPVVTSTPKISTTQDARWFSENGVDYIGTNLNLNNGNPYVQLPSYLKKGTIATLTMDSGTVYQMDSDRKFIITELNFNPTWIYAGSEKERSWTVNLSYNDPVNGVITGSVKDRYVVNDMKSPN